MKLAVVGSRTWRDWKAILLYIYRVYPSLIVTGGASGADRIAIDTADSLDIPHKEFPPDWKKYGKSAGAIRNRQIVDACDGLVAFWDGKSRGTKISIDMAKRAGKLIEVVLATGAQTGAK